MDWSNTELKIFEYKWLEKRKFCTLTLMPIGVKFHLHSMNFSLYLTQLTIRIITEFGKK